MFRKSFATLALTLSAVSTFAMPKPSEVDAAYKSHDYPRAESLLKEVLAAKDSPKAHWQLGQVYSAEGKHQQGLAEMKEAARLDPSFKFASNAAAGVRIMSNEQALAAPPVAVIQSPIAIPQGYATVAQASPNTMHSESSHVGLIVFLLLLFVAAGVGVYFFLSGKKKETSNIAKEDSDKKSQLLDLAKRLDDAVLITKTAGFSVDDTSTILTRINGLQQSVRQSLADIKDGKAPSNSYLANLASMVDNVCNQSQTGVKNGFTPPQPMPPAPAPAPESSYGALPPNADSIQIGESVESYQQRRASPTPAPTYVAPTPTQTVFHHQYPAPAPVVNNSGSDMLTGLLIGEALSRPERVVERTVYVEERAPAPAPYYAPAPAPYYAPAPAQLDSNDDDSYDRSPSGLDSSSSSSDSYDSGSSSDSSSSDSGSSDSY